jgi:hypothetical protein
MYHFLLPYKGLGCQGEVLFSADGETGSTRCARYFGTIQGLIAGYEIPRLNAVSLNEVYCGTM